MTNRKKLLTVTKGNKSYLSRNVNTFGAGSIIDKASWKHLDDPLTNINNPWFSIIGGNLGGDLANIIKPGSVDTSYSLKLLTLNPLMNKSNNAWKWPSLSSNLNTNLGGALHNLSTTIIPALLESLITQIPSFNYLVDNLAGNYFDAITSQALGSIVAAPSIGGNMSNMINKSINDTVTKDIVTLSKGTAIADLTNKIQGVGNPELLKPTAKKGLSLGAKNAIGAGASIVGGLAGGLIGGGLQSTAGNAISGIGSTAGAVMSAIPGIGTMAGGIVAGASGLLGGLTNRMFGSKLNKENIAKFETLISGLNDTARGIGSANSADEINNSLASINFNQKINKSDVGKDGWFSNKASRETARLNRELESAKTYALGAASTGINNINQRQYDSVMSNVAAFGGYLDDIDPTTPIGYSMLTDKLTNDNNKNNNKNMTNIFARTPNMFAMGSPLFAFGGNVETHGGTYSTDLTHIDTGGSHEENPNEGVLMGVDHQGTPNLVEEGEVIYDDYVFSDRLTVPEISKKKDLSYDEKVLKKYSGKTYADAAKKAEKESGVDERPNDEVSRKTFEAILEVLAQSQEKEREMDKLRQMQEAIRQMTPEEFTMMLQQQAEQEAQLRQAEEDAMMQQQLMQQPQQVQLQEIPQGMEYMLQPIEELQPIAALGGLLNIPNNMYAYGGNLAKFKEDLEKIGLTLEDYYIASLGSYENSMLEEAARDIFRNNSDLINDSNFDKNYAEKYLNRAKRIEKGYRDRAKKIGINYDNLGDIEKSKINKDIVKAINNSFSNDDYKLDNDDSLFINSLAAQSATSQKEVRLNLRNSSLNDYMDTQGSRTVTVGENGKLPWNTSVNGLVKSQYRLPKLDENGNYTLNEAGERLYSDYQDVDDDYFNNGYYKEDADNRFNYNSGVKSSIADADNVTLYGWKLNDDGLWVKDESAIYNKDSENVKKGKTANHFEPWTNLTKEQIILLLEQLDYKDQTKAVSDAIEAANGNFDNLDPKILNYLKFLDSKTGTILKLLGADGKTLSGDTATLYKNRRTDNLYGPYHYGFDIGSNGTADRYFYKKGDLRVYVDKPDDSWGYTIKDPVKTTIGDTDFNDYEIEGITGNRVYTQMPDGTIKDVTNVAGVDKWKDAEAPYEDDESPLGFTGTTRWVLLPEDQIKLSTEKKGNDKFPTPSDWPYWLAGAAQLGTLGYNIFKKPDYSRAEALIKAAKEIGKPQLIQFRPIGNLLEYRPMDVLSELNRQNAIARSTDRYITNNAMPISSQIAGLIANGYNSQLASGQLFENALKYNDKRSLEVAEYNKDTAKFNSEGFLKADMANQDAANRAKIYSLEGLKSGYTMEQAIADARSNAINAGISGLVNLGLSYALNKWNNDLYKYAIDKGAFAGVGAKGGKLRKRNKGLNF